MFALVVANKVRGFLKFEFKIKQADVVFQTLPDTSNDFLVDLVGLFKL